jgi:hypothetical protein
MKRLSFVFGQVLGVLLGSVITLASQHVSATPASQVGDKYFPETGYNVPAVFYRYWLTHGGLAQQGYPITEAANMVSPTNGQTYLTQYFQRARFEYHPELRGTGNEVLLGLLGVEVVNCSGVTVPSPPPPSEKTFQVKANSDWQDTGVSANAGQSVSILYVSGTWSPFPGYSYDGRGCTDTRVCSQNPNDPKNVIPAIHGALIGRIGSGQTFVVNNGVTLTAGNAGSIHLRINDKIIDDNSGTLTVRVSVGSSPGPVPQPTQPPPPPSSDTPPGSILEVGRAWRQGGIELNLTRVNLSPHRAQLSVMLANRQDRSIAIRYSPSETISVRDNLGRALRATFYSCSGYDDLSLINIVLAPNQRVPIIPQRAYCGADDSVEVAADITNPALTEIQVTFTGISTITNARWRIPIEH